MSLEELKKDKVKYFDPQGDKMIPLIFGRDKWKHKGFSTE